MISHDKRSDCKTARVYYYDVLDTDAETSVPEDVRRHIADCVHCQADVSQLKALLADAGKKNESEQSRKDSAISTLLSLHFAWADKPVTCNSVKSFLPSLADPLLQITIPTPITAHVAKCRRCSDELSEIASLGLTHKQLCCLGQTMAEAPSEDAAGHTVAEKVDSGITTRFTFRESDDEKAQTESDLRYADWPISVEVLGQTATRDGDTIYSSGPKKSALVVSLRRHLKPALAAAAVLLIGVALIFSATTARAVSVKGICRTIEKARNVYITRFDGDMTEPEQERWVSRPLSIYVLKEGRNVTLWDFHGSPKKIVSSHDVAPKSVAFDEESAAAARATMNSPLRTLLSNAPPDTKWTRVPKDTLESDAQNFDVYELEWTGGPYPGAAKPSKWRVFMEPGTHNPRRALLFSKQRFETDYALRNKYAIEYLGDEDMARVIEPASP